MNFNLDDINLIDEIEVIINTDPYKRLHKKIFDGGIQEELIYEANRWIHKRTFYKDLWEDLMPIVWHPTRILEWCLDVEELEYLKERWGIDW